VTDNGATKEARLVTFIVRPLENEEKVDVGVDVDAEAVVGIGRREGFEKLRW
jgi:phage host-nuclease inhibitor protein Gam